MALLLTCFLKGKVALEQALPCPPRQGREGRPWRPSPGLCAPRCRGKTRRSAALLEKRFRRGTPAAPRSSAHGADTLPTTFRASTIGPVPPADPRRITPEEVSAGGARCAAPGWRCERGRGRRAPASCELANRRSVFRGGCRPSPDSGGAETGDPSGAPAPAEPASRPGPSRLCPRRAVRAGVRAQTARRPPARRLPRARGWPSRPALLLHAARAHCRLLLLLSQVWGASSLQARRRYLTNPAPRGSLSTYCANAFLSLSQLSSHYLPGPCSPPFRLATAPEGQLHHSGFTGSDSPYRPAGSPYSQGSSLLSLRMYSSTPQHPATPKSTVCPL